MREKPSDEIANPTDDAEPEVTQAVIQGDSKSSRLVDILDTYLAELERGETPDKAELLAANPSMAGELEACLAGLDFIHGFPSSQAAPPHVGDFRILREIGCGGMGTVYEAEQKSLQRRVALKVLRVASTSGDDVTERFQREAETLADLHHTNIVPIFAVGRENRIAYFAMQFIDGPNLAQVLAEQSQPLDPMRVAAWGLQGAEALAHAHRSGVIHRDVKPSNLLLGDGDRVWLTDFGLAKRLEDVTLSMAGALLGTPRYMSPEQASLKDDIDHRTDVYSLGATLYELVTGQPVFDGDTVLDVITQIIDATPIPPGQLRPDLPGDLEAIILKCLAKDPESRYGSAG